MNRLFLPEEGEDLDPANRQRCLVTILATRPERFPLALHVFLGLLEGIPISEMRNIFFLVGVYTGIPGMVSGDDLLTELLQILGAELGDGTGKAPAQILTAVFGRLLGDFSALPPSEQLVRALASTTKLSEADVRALLARAHELVARDAES